MTAIFTQLIYLLLFQLDDWVLCRIYKKSNNFQFSDQEQEGSTVEEEDSYLTLNNNTDAAPSPKSEAVHASEDHHQFHPHVSMAKSCSLTDLFNTLDYSTLSQLLLDTPAETEPQQQSPLIYTTPALDVNNNNSTHTPHVDALGSDYYAANYNSLKRKRIMTVDGGSFDDGSSLKRKQQVPGDSRSGTLFGSTSSYCNQQLAEAASSNFQYSNFLNQQLLLSNHLEMQ